MISNSVFPWGHERRFNAYPDYFRRLYGSRVQKLSIDAGFTCPNRDGSKGLGGCTYCNNDAFNPSYCQPEKSVTQQIEEGIIFHKNRYRRADKYLAYFQAFSEALAEDVAPDVVIPVLMGAILAMMDNMDPALTLQEPPVCGMPRTSASSA